MSRIYRKWKDEEDEIVDEMKKSRIDENRIYRILAGMEEDEEDFKL